MDRSYFGELALLTIRAPREAASEIMSLRIDRGSLWAALALAAILNTLLFSFSISMVESTQEIPSLFTKPFVFFVILAGLLVLTVHALYWTGLSLGGKGDLGDLLSLTVWLQFLRVAAQAILILLLMIAPAFGLLFSLATGILGLWILVNFIASALHFPSVLYGVATLVLAAVGLVLAILVIGGLIGLSSLGVSANV